MKRGYQIIGIPKYPKCYTDQKNLLLHKIDPIIIDIGAHHGETIKQYKNQFPEARITAFEPFPPSFQVLKAKTQMITSLTLVNAAVGSQDETITFFSNKISQTNSLLPLSDEAEFYWGENLLEAKEEIKVNCIKLDSYLEKNPMKAVDILKIDTQGYEYEVIKGAENTLLSGMIKIVYCEVILASTYKGQHRMDEIMHALRHAGFEVYNIYNPSYTELGRLRQIDMIFIHKDYLNELEKSLFNP